MRAPQTGGHYQLLILLVHSVVAVVIVVAATILSGLGAIDAEAVTTIYGAALGLVGGAASSATVTGQLVNGRQLVGERRLSELAEHGGERSVDPANGQDG